MSQSETIDDFAEKINGWTWQLEPGQGLRTTLVEETTNEQEINACPLAMLAITQRTEHIRQVLAGLDDEKNMAGQIEATRNNRIFIDGMNAMAQSCGEQAASDDEMFRFAAAMAIHENPWGLFAEKVLDLDSKTLKTIQDAADNPDRELGTELVMGVARATDDPDLLDQLHEIYDVPTTPDGTAGKPDERPAAGS